MDMKNLVQIQLMRRGRHTKNQIRKTIKLYEKISKATRSKEAWDILGNSHSRGEKVKKVKLQSYRRRKLQSYRRRKLQSYRRRYEIMQKEEDQNVSDYFSKLIEFLNQMKNCGENISDQMVVEKVLRSLSPKFDFIVVAIQEAKDVKTMKIEELQSSLEAHELMVIIKDQKDRCNKLFKFKQPRKREITKISRRKEKVKQIGQIMGNSKLVTKLNLQKEEVWERISTRKRILIRVKFSSIIVRSIDILLMNVRSRRIKRLKEKKI